MSHKYTTEENSLKINAKKYIPTNLHSNKKIKYCTYGPEGFGMMLHRYAFYLTASLMAQCNEKQLTVEQKKQLALFARPFLTKLKNDLFYLNYENYKNTNKSKKII